MLIPSPAKSGESEDLLVGRPRGLLSRTRARFAFSCDMLEGWRGVKVLSFLHVWLCGSETNFTLKNYVSATIETPHAITSDAYDPDDVGP
jgi:hypothetical protein